MNLFEWIVAVGLIIFVLSKVLRLVGWSFRAEHQDVRWALPTIQYIKTLPKIRQDKQGNDESSDGTSEPSSGSQSREKDEGDKP